MRQLTKILSLITRMFVLAFLLSAAWVLGGLQGLFDHSDGEANNSVDPLFKLNKANADIVVGDSGPTTDASPAPSDSDPDGGDGGY